MTPNRRDDSGRLFGEGLRRFMSRIDVTPGCWLWTGPPADLLSYRGWTGKQTENRLSHWIWRQYADCMWDDIRIGRVLPFKAARDTDDEKHVHPLQLDVIDRVVALRSLPGEAVLTPFMGVGSEVYGALCAGRRGIGIELKSSYYRQAALNVEAARDGKPIEEQQAFALDDAEAEQAV